MLTIGLKADLDLSGDFWKRISGIRELTVESRGKALLSTDFLTYLPLIRTLTLSGVAVEDTAGFAALENLGTLYIYGCRIADWSFIQNLQGLTAVKVYGSELEDSDLPYFASLRALDELRLNGNRITDLTALLSSQTLRKLDILDNPIADYSPLLSMPALRMVYLDQGGIITGDYILARSVYVDNVDYKAIYEDAFGGEADATP